MGNRCECDKPGWGWWWIGILIASCWGSEDATETLKHHHHDAQGNVVVETETPTR